MCAHRTHSQLAQVVDELKRTDYVVRSTAPVNIVLTKNDAAAGVTATQGDFFSGEVRSLLAKEMRDFGFFCLQNA